MQSVTKWKILLLAILAVGYAAVGLALFDINLLGWQDWGVEVWDAIAVVAWSGGIIFSVWFFSRSEMWK